MQQVSVQGLIFQCLCEGNRSRQSCPCSRSSGVQGLKQHVPTQWDPEVALTQLGLQKPHVCVAGFDAPPRCVLSKLSSACSTPLRRPSPKEYSGACDCSEVFWRRQ